MPSTVCVSSGFDIRERFGQNRRCCGVAGAFLQLYALVTRKWKLVHDLSGSDGQLFHRPSDPLEVHNLYSQDEHITTRDALLLALLRWRAALEPTESLKAGISKADKPNKTRVEWTNLVWTSGMRGTDPELQLQRDLIRMSKTIDVGCGQASVHGACAATEQLRARTP